MNSNPKQKVRLEDLADFLFEQWQLGYLPANFAEFVEETGTLPIRMIRDQLQLVIEHSDEEGFMNVSKAA